MPEIGEQAPDFTLQSTEGAVNLRDLTERSKVVLAFYYEDATPLCSNEVSMLKDDYDFARELGAEVIGISADSVESHRAFIERLGGGAVPPAPGGGRGGAAGWER